MRAAGLSLDQGPPFSIPMRHFVAACAHGALAAALIAARPDALSSRWTPLALACTHLLVLGFVVQAMLGALQQVLPVVSGGRLRGASLVGGLVHALWNAGVLALAAGLGTGRGLATGAGATLLALAAAVFLGAALPALARGARSAAVASARFACGGFATAVALGVVLAAGHAQLLPLHRFTLTDAHAAWGLVGWIAALVLSLSWQLVPMLLTTPPYPRVLQSFAVPALVALLAAWSLLGAWPKPKLAAGLALAALLATWAIVTLVLLSRRLRRLPDATVDCLVAALLALPGGCAALALHRVLGGERLLLAGGLLLALGFASVFIVGMLLKIVPFLAWLHLQAESGRSAAAGGAASRVPTMKELLPDRRARLQARLHVVASAALVLSLAWAPLRIPASLALAGSFALLGLSLADVARAAAGRR